MSDSGEAKVLVRFVGPSGKVIEEQELPRAPKAGEGVKLRGVTWTVMSLSWTGGDEVRGPITAWVEC